MTHTISFSLSLFFVGFFCLFVMASTKSIISGHYNTTRHGIQCIKLALLYEEVRERTGRKIKRETGDLQSKSKVKERKYS